MPKFLKAVLWTAIALVIVGGILRALLFKVWTIPGDELVLGASVEPSLRLKDTIVVLTRGKRGFGDLVRCTDPDDSTKFLIGRIIGVAGDIIELKGRRVYVNGKVYDIKQACPDQRYWCIHPNSEAEVEMQCGVVEMGGGWHYRGNEKKAAQATTFKAEVGDGMVFLLSDNIDLHDDSRDFGTLEASTCTEKIVFRLWGEAGFKDAERRMMFIH